MKTPSTVLFELTRSFEAPLHANPLKIIRATFGTLMDQAANELTRRGLDQDDCLLERWARIRRVGSGDEAEFMVQGLADTDAFWKSAPQPRSKDVASEGPYRGTITRLSVRVILEEGVPFGRCLPVGDSGPPAGIQPDSP